MGIQEVLDRNRAASILDKVAVLMMESGISEDIIGDWPHNLLAVLASEALDMILDVRVFLSSRQYSYSATV